MDLTLLMFYFENVLPIHKLQCLRNFVTLCKKSFVNMSKRHAYSIEFKTEVIKFAKKHSNRETGRKFKID